MAPIISGFIFQHTENSIFVEDSLTPEFICNYVKKLIISVFALKQRLNEVEIINLTVAHRIVIHLVVMQIAHMHHLS